eukprot:SAG31_NODE_20183_length_581_cov_1.257261_2_plen_144_part_01
MNNTAPDCPRGHWWRSNVDCEGLTVCSRDRSQRELLPPTEVRDRQCAAITVCGADEYEEQPPQEIPSDNEYNSQTKECDLQVMTYRDDRVCHCLRTCGLHAETVREPDPNAATVEDKNRECRCIEGHYRNTHDAGTCPNDEFTC